ncbi:Nodulin-like [Dillenia turbinata]|uniref:Nodulin-like n=1 Tax=Dillenia turbinata TaxID=194707 RepID=A0AAN8UPM1_9MAGN
MKEHRREQKKDFYVLNVTLNELLNSENVKMDSIKVKLKELFKFVRAIARSMSGSYGSALHCHKKLCRVGHCCPFNHMRNFPVSRALLLAFSKVMLDWVQQYLYSCIWEDSSEPNHFRFTQAASVCLGIYLLAITVLSDLVSLSTAFSFTFVAIMIVILIISEEPENVPEADLLLGGGKECSGITALNNLAQIGYAMGFDDTTILLSHFSFCNFLGLLGGRGVSEYLIRNSELLEYHVINGTLYGATALLGICYGVQFAIMVPTASVLFGLEHFGIIYNFMLLGNPIGALLFSGLLAGYVYDAKASKQQTSVCLGAECFRLTFLILTDVCRLGSILA